MHGLKSATPFLILLLLGQGNPQMFGPPLTGLIDSVSNLLRPPPPNSDDPNPPGRPPPNLDYPYPDPPGRPPPSLLNPLPNLLNLPLRPFQEILKRITDPLVRTALNGSIHFFLFNREYPNGRILPILDYNTVYPTIDRELIILIPGYLTDVNSDMPQTLKDTYLATRDVNVIIVDWSPIARFPVYLLSTRAVPVLGETIALLLQRIYQGQPQNTTINTHLLGHSIGADAAGNTGRTLRQMTGQVPYRITGLDPANPLLNPADPFNQDGLTLSVNDAPFVDVIHSSDVLGIHVPIGHVDFYPNGGSVLQPNCPLLESIKCGHLASWKYYAESIRNPTKYIALRCMSYDAFKEGQCDDRVYMGEATPPLTRGTYYLLI